MRRISFIATAAAMLSMVAGMGFAAPPQAAKSGSGKIVIVFKDGHRQSFSLAEIDRVEFPAGPAAAAESVPAPPGLPPRGHFIGKWVVGDGSGNDFYITLKDNGEAWRSLRSVGGRWQYVNGEAQVIWDDGAKDAIRKVGNGYQKFAYGSGKSFSDAADNVTGARNTTPHSI